MYLLGKITVTPVLPKKLERLKDLAYNLWWSWNSEAIDLYRELDLDLWRKIDKNPVRFIQEVSQKKLADRLNDPGYMKMYDKVIQAFDSYMVNKNTWFNINFPESSNEMVAYFSAEYGLNEVLPIYSGGLGVLSGDYCKSASDLGIPFTAIGLFYKHGYFNQHINREGWQETIFTNLDTTQLPVLPVVDNEGKDVLIDVELADRIVCARVWRIKVGRVSIYLMDTDVELNNALDRSLTARLYGGDQETRIQQEILLGMGGIKVLEALGINASVYHMNEGHSAFMGLEVIRGLMQCNNLTFKTAKEAVSSFIVFTTHTPVPAGNDVFPVNMVEKYFNKYWESIGVSRQEFLSMGLKATDNQNFNMTVLALDIAGRRNGVSELHGAVTRNIFNNLWPDIPENEVPVTHITNGIHTFTWLSPSFKNICDKYFDEGWQETIHKKETWEKADNIPDDELWEIHCTLKKKTIDFIRKKVRMQKMINVEPVDAIKETAGFLDPGALTIGFARRFATYKRANLIFRDMERIRQILNNPQKPVQIIFAGKAHPADRPAQEVIKNINEISRQEGFKGKVILVENYNMTISRHLVQGVDVWLNNPRRPLEASGTSGQKACINGIINFSILDGWWCEGYNGKNGWAIGDDTFYDNEYYQDNADSESIYNILEKQIIPLFYNRDSKNVPVKWIKLMKESIKSTACQFSTHRMIQEYVETMYLPCMKKALQLKSGNYENAKNMVEWKSFIKQNWPCVSLITEKSLNRLKGYRLVSGETVRLTVTADLGGIDPESVKVEVYYGIADKDNIIENPEIKEMSPDGKYLDEKTSGRKFPSIESLNSESSNNIYAYSTDIKLLDGGEYAYTFRIFPHHPDLTDKFEMKLIKWAE